MSSNNRFKITDLLFPVNYIFPSKCVSCGMPVSYSLNCLCINCFNKIKLIENGCRKCSGEMSNGRCIICSDRMFYLDKNIAISEYEGVMMDILHNLKFNRRKRLYFKMAELVFNELLKHDIEYDYITSVPMNRSKKWKRGFNQSELIARWISQKADKAYIKSLKERTWTNAQKDLRFKDRFINVLNRYEAINHSRIAGKRILLVDDIFTSGATLNECARMLKSNGVKEVYSLTIARTGIKKLENL